MKKLNLTRDIGSEDWKIEALIKQGFVPLGDGHGSASSWRF